MYEQIEKQKKTRRPTTFSTTQRKSSDKQGVAMTDNRLNPLLQKMVVIQRETAKFSSLDESGKLEAENLFNMHKGLNGAYYDEMGERSVNNNKSTQAFIDSILRDLGVRVNLENRLQFLRHLGIKLVEPKSPEPVDMSQFIGSTYSCLNGQLLNILGDKTQGLLNGQTFRGSQMYHIGGRFPSVGKPIWILTNNKVDIIGMYTHPGQNFKEYKRLEGVGPNRFTLG